jgi:hypothetical protein
MELECSRKLKLGYIIFLEFRALPWYLHVGPLEVTDRQTSGVRIHKVADHLTTIDEKRSIVFAVEEVTVIDQKTSGCAMTGRTGANLIKSFLGDDEGFGDQEAILDMIGTVGVANDSVDIMEGSTVAVRLVGDMTSAAALLRHSLLSSPGKTVAGQSEGSQEKPEDEK